MIIRGVRIINVPLPVPSGNRILMYGDSITADAGATNHASSYVGRYQTLTGLDPRVMAQYGRTVQENIQSFNVTNSLYNVLFNPTSDQAQYNPNLPYDANYKYLTIRLGVNDVLQKPGSATDATTFKNTYQTCINKFFDLGWPRNRIFLINIGSYLGSVAEIQQAVIDYNQVILELSQENAIGHIDLHEVDLQHNGETLYADDVHPNDTGHNIHAILIAQTLP